MDPIVLSILVILLSYISSLLGVMEVLVIYILAHFLFNYTGYITFGDNDLQMLTNIAELGLMSLMFEMGLHTNLGAIVKNPGFAAVSVLQVLISSYLISFVVPDVKSAIFLSTSSSMLTMFYVKRAKTMTTTHQLLLINLLVQDVFGLSTFGGLNVSDKVYVNILATVIVIFAFLFTIRFFKKRVVQTVNFLGLWNFRLGIDMQKYSLLSLAFMMIIVKFFHAIFRTDEIGWYVSGALISKTVLEKGLGSISSMITTIGLGCLYMRTALYRMSYLEIFSFLPTFAIVIIVKTIVVYVLYSFVIVDTKKNNQHAVLLVSAPGEFIFLSSLHSGSSVNALCSMFLTVVYCILVNLVLGLSKQKMTLVSSNIAVQLNTLPHRVLIMGVHYQSLALMTYFKKANISYLGIDRDEKLVLKYSGRFNLCRVRNFTSEKFLKTVPVSSIVILCVNNHQKVVSVVESTYESGHKFFVLLFSQCESDILKFREGTKDYNLIYGGVREIGMYVKESLDR